MKPAPRARGPAYLNQTPETHPPIHPAEIQPPRRTNIWQGENSGPLQLLNTFAFPAVDKRIDVPTNGEFAVIAPLFKEGDAAWLGLDRSRFLADVSYSNECVEAMEKAKKIYSEIVARIDANPRRQMEMAPPVCRAVALVRSAWINIFLNRLGESDNLYALALEGVTPLAEHDSEQFGPLCSWFLSERAYMKCMEGRFEEAIPDLEEALTLLESNIILAAPGCAVQVAVLHASLGGMYRAVGQNEKALEDTSEAIDIVEGILSSTSSATNHPSTFQPFIDFLAGCHYRRDETLKDLAKQQ
jgi:tetratricopeptide (TPR) repeat protein